jgi:hypothetical protein
MGADIMECVMCTDESIEFKDILVKFNEDWDDIESNICENHRDKLTDIANEFMARKLTEEWEK